MRFEEKIAYHFIADKCPVSLILVNKNGIIEYINSATEELFLYLKEELVGKSVEQLFVDEIHAELNKNLFEYSNNPIKKRIFENQNIYAYKKNGKSFPVDLILNHINPDSNNTILLSIIDISKKIEEEEEKLRKERLFRTVVESAPNGIILVDQSGNITLVNKQTENLFKYKREELLNKSISMLIPERFRSQHPELINSFLSKPQSRPMGAGRDLFGVRKDGIEIPIEIGLNPIQTEDGIMVLTSVIDISERKKLEERQNLYLKHIQEKNKELEQFAYIASHDLRAPLQTISSFTELLLEDQSDVLDTNAINNLNFIKDATDRMGKLITHLLDYGRIGKSSEIMYVDLNKVLKNVLADLSNSIEKSRAVINLEKLPCIHAYETEIRLLFQNLISNAIKFMKPNVKPVITISVKETKNLLAFKVQDNGIGIPQEDQKSIFSLFKRADGARNYEGTGIGLAHCKKIANMHNGDIWVESNNGKGSIFYFTISTKLKELHL